MKFIFKGKTKDVYELDDGNYLMRFKDDATGKDGKFDPGENQIIGKIEGKGKAGLKLSSYLFGKINEAGYPTHFISADTEKAEMCVKPAAVFGKGIEVICRFKAAGSFIRRYGQYAKENDILDAVVEVTLKDDERGDPPVTKEILGALGILTADEYETLTNLTKSIAGVIKSELAEKNLELIDIKLEFGRDREGKIMLIDEVSGDCMRVVRIGGDSDGGKVSPTELEQIMKST
jgi:phosphoribosylaminoimidazole-succinocarboxamide synthase